MIRDAIRLHQSGRLAEAASSYRNILKSDPTNSIATHHLGLILFQQGEEGEGSFLLNRSIALEPKNTTYLINYASLLLNSKRLDDAVAILSAGAALNPHSAELNIELAVALCMSGRTQEGLSFFKKTLKLDPKNKIATYGMANALRALDDSHGAMAALNTSQGFCRDDQSHQILYASLLNDVGEHNQAISICSRILKDNPESTEALACRGNAYQRKKIYKKAELDYQSLLTRQPEHTETLQNYGTLKLHTDDLEAAISLLRSCLKSDPTNVEAEWALSHALLASGDLLSGWVHYESRHRLPNRPWPVLKTQNPIWSPSRRSSRLLIWPEQGLGDEVFFSRWLRHAEHLAEEIRVLVDDRLYKPFSRSFPNLRFFKKSSPLNDKDFDCHLPMGSLPLNLYDQVKDATEITTPYLQADNHLSAEMRNRLASDGEVLCGITWRSARPKLGVEKSVSLLDFAPLLSTPGIRFVNLQYGETDTDLEELKAKTGLELSTDHGIDNKDDLEGHLALLNACDQLIMVCNASAHLAGALGKNVNLLTPTGETLIWYWRNRIVKNNFWYRTITHREKTAACSVAR